MADVRIDAFGLDGIDVALRQMGPSFMNRLLGPSLAATARVVRDAARKTTVFEDRSGRLRRSIRAARIPARYGGMRFRRGRAAVIAGGRIERAPHAHLVERGHGGPYPARPHPFLFRALMQTEARQASAFATRAQLLFPRLVREFQARSNLGSISTVSRTIARRRR